EVHRRAADRPEQRPDRVRPPHRRLVPGAGGGEGPPGPGRGLRAPGARRGRPRVPRGSPGPGPGAPGGGGHRHLRGRRHDAAIARARGRAGEGESGAGAPPPRQASAGGSRYLDRPAQEGVTGMTVRPAVFPAAGLGTRFLPATKAQPKEMLPLVDKPMIQYVVEEAVQAGLDRLTLVTGRGKRAIEDHFDAAVELEFYLQERGKWEELVQIKTISDLASVSYIRQKEPLGLGHAILCARPLVGEEPFAVFLGDDII